MIFALLFALPLVVAETPRLLVLEPQVVEAHGAAATGNDVRALQRSLVQELARIDGVVVVDTQDLAQLATIGATQLEAGCDADACLGELSDALGAELIVLSELGRLGDRAQWQIKVWDQHSATIAARHTIDAADVGGLAIGIPAAVEQLVQPLRQRGLTYERSDATSPLFVVGATALGVGAAAAVVGVAGLGLGSIIVPDDGYDTSLRRGFQGAGPGLVTVAAVGGGIVVVAVALLVVDALH